MKLVFIRHGDPDYEADTLTPRGILEAQALADYLYDTGFKPDHCYVSVLGRAKKTAEIVLEKLSIPVTAECEWLQEFTPRIDRPDNTEKKNICWDWLPADWTADDRFYSYDTWTDNERMAAGDVGGEFRKVTGAFDELLASHGYVHCGNIFRVERANEDTIAFFCHFGITGVLLSHLFHVSPMIMLHSLIAAPTSVTRVVTEERREGTASFRMTAFGETAHLARAGLTPSVSGRFCETYEAYLTKGQRRD
ncbi:MAG: phosphoglycerate mutase family protein [Lachnospiraceae bacterium]|nr:phosphoglycerate mutase family protein [Lachnospiraceae bacterium]